VALTDSEGEILSLSGRQSKPAATKMEDRGGLFVDKKTRACSPGFIATHWEGEERNEKKR
jgi:hypothetical protein